MAKKTLIDSISSHHPSVKSSKAKTKAIKILGMFSISIDLKIREKHPELLAIQARSKRPQLEWEFFFIVGGAKTVLLSSQCSDILRENILIDLKTVDNKMYDALKDLEGFLKQRDGTFDAPVLIGLWILWNLGQQEPSFDEFKGLAPAIGGILTTIVEKQILEELVMSGAVVPETDISIDDDYINAHNLENRIEYYDNGQKKIESIFNQSNIRDGKWISYYDTGQVMGIGCYKEGKPEGEWTKYYINGQIKEVFQFKDGKEEDTSIAYFEIGRIMLRGNYIHGKEDGEWIAYDENGEEIGRKQYKNGNEIL